MDILNLLSILTSTSQFSFIDEGKEIADGFHKVSKWINIFNSNRTWRSGSANYEQMWYSVYILVTVGMCMGIIIYL